MSKRILVVDGHPWTGSFCESLARAYTEGAEAGGSDVRVVVARDLSFGPLPSRHGPAVDLEPDILAVQDGITWCQHMAFVYPIWWGGPPALLRSLVERVFLPGFAFKYRDRGGKWDRLLTGRSGELLVTMDTPPFVYRWMYAAAGDRIMAGRTLDYCGVKPVRATHFGIVKTAEASTRNRWLDEARALGKRAAG